MYELQCNFMSVTRAIEHGFQLKFENKSAGIKNKENQIILVAQLQSELFLFKIKQMVLTNCVLLNQFHFFGILLSKYVFRHK